MPERKLAERHAALEKTVAKYRGRKLDWVSADCLRMVRSHLREMGHRKLPRIPAYRSALGARRALDEAGGSLEAILDTILPRIAPAAMWPGDVALMQGEEGFDALTICVGRKVMGWHADSEEAVIIQPFEIKAAWRA